MSAVLDDHFPSDRQICPIRSVSCFSFYSISIKLHFLSSPMILFSNSACCLLSFSQRVFRTVASWQTAYSKLLSCHIAASSCSQLVVQVQRKRTKRDCNRIKNSVSNSTQIVRGAKQQYNTFCKVTPAYILMKTSCHQEVTSTILVKKGKKLVTERII